MSKFKRRDRVLFYRRWCGLVLLLMLLIAGRECAGATAYQISNFAGPAGNTGADDGSGTAARFYGPAAVAVDKSGNVYVADSSNNTIRLVTPAGVVSTYAGLSGVYGAADGTSVAAGFYLPKGIAVDGSGNVYVGDTYNHTIRKIAPGGIVTTLAGTAGSIGSADGTGSAARFNYPLGVAVDASGNVYVADSLNDTIRMITPAGVVTTLAGTAGTSGSSDGTGTAARFYQPQSVSVDSNGNVYVADTYNHTIRKIASGGVVTTFAGTAGTSGFTNATGTAATFYYPSGVYADGSGNVYVADSYNLVIRKINSNAVVSTFAGTGYFGGSDGAGSVATFTYPGAVCGDSNSNLYIADTGNNTIRKITSGAVVSTLAGTESNIGSANGAGTAAYFYYPQGIAADSSGTFYISDSANDVIRKITAAGAVSTLAGTAETYGSVDGTGSSALFDYPQGLAVDSSKNVYVADYYNHTIRKITPAGVVTTIAGTAGTAGSTDGTGTAATFNYPTGVALDNSNNIYVADSGNYTIRKITPAGVVTTYAGTAGTSGSSDGTGSAALFYVPSGIASDSSNNLYVTDQYNQTIRKIAPGGVVTTLAGSAGTVGNSDGTGTAALFNYPYGLTVDTSGNIYVADYGNETIRKIAPGNVVTTLAGAPLQVGSLNGTGGAARFFSPSGVALDASGNFYVVDSGNNSIRVGKPTILDAATIDAASGPVGVTRQLGTSPQTATAWTWSFFRKPANSTALLSSTTSRTPTFTPDVADDYVFKLVATGTGGTSVTLVSLSTANAAPTITSPLTATALVGSLFSYEIVTTGFPAATYTANPLPAGLTLSNGYIYGTPTTNGITNITLTAINGVGAPDQETLTLTVYQAPSIVSSLTASGEVGKSFSYTIEALGYPTPIFTASPLPGGLSLSGKTIFGTPTAIGVTNVALTASNDISPNDQETLVITIKQTPTIASATPNYGLDTGGTSVTLTGTNFISGASVTFGGTSATNVVVNSLTSITCTTPAHADGAAGIAITTPGGSASLASGYTFIGAPTITGITPNVGQASASQSVTIAGTNFTSGSTVTFGGTAATNVVVTNTSITCVAPALAAGTVDVVVTTLVGNATLAGGFSYLPAPTLTSVSPNSGSNSGGTSVTITGANFVQNGLMVQFGGSAASNVSVVSSTQITCNTPPGALGSVAVSITTAGGSVSSSGAYTYLLLPTLANINPNTGPVAGGQSVTLIGSNFTAGATVTMEGSAALNVTVQSSSSITCTTPAHAAGIADVTVICANGSVTLTGGYAFVPAPSISSVTPDVGPVGGGQSITISGTNFAAGATVTIGGSNATSIVVVNATTITCKTPSHAAGAADVVVSTGGGSQTLSGGYRYGVVPAITNANTATFVVGTPGAFEFTTTGTPTPQSSITSGTLPSGISFVDNGNGTATLSGTPPAGSAGNVVLTITAMSSSGSVQQTFTLTIITPTPVVGTGLDSDGDGFADAFETAVGTNPLDASSTPFGGAHATTSSSLILSKPTISLNFAKANSDAIKFTGTVAVPQGFNFATAIVYVDVGGVARKFPLTSKGSSVVGTDSIKIAFKATKGVVNAQTAAYSVAITKGSYSAALASSGLTNTTVKNSPVTVVFTLLFNDMVFKTSRGMSYTATAGKAGSAK